MAKLSVKLLNKEVVKPLVDGYFLHRKKINCYFRKNRGSKSNWYVDERLNNEEFETELPMPVFDKVEPAKPIEDLSKAVIAVVTTGGIVPLGNPDRIHQHLHKNGNMMFLL